MALGVVAQNVEIYEGDGLDKSARTGAVSGNQLVRAGAQGVILGHSEVGDSPEIIHKKLFSLLDQRILERLVVLVGESWDEFEKNNPEQIAKLMRKKCDIIFRDIPPGLLNNIMVGYEPKWGSRRSGRKDVPPPQPEVISACILELRQFFKENYGGGIQPLFVYGGSSTPERTKQILADKNIDGLILGSACNTVEKTLAVVNTMEEVCGNRKKVVICNFKAYELPDSYAKYIDALGVLSDEFVILLAPPYTDIRLVSDLLDEKGLLLK